MIIKKTAPKSKTNKPYVKHILYFSFIAGGILQVLACEIYRNTIIDWWVAPSVWLVTGIIAQRFLADVLSTSAAASNYFLQLFHCLMSFGGPASYLFLATNYYIDRGSPSELVKVAIQRTGHLATGLHECGNPYTMVTIHNADKQLIFPCDLDISRYRYVIVNTKKGLLGYDCITDKRLIEE